MDDNGSAMDSRAALALHGVRVLDLTHQVAGPSATLALAVLGADVVKVVAPGDRSSHDLLPFYFNNASKRSIVVDLKTDEGMELVLEMAQHADVFAENFGPGVIERLGLSYEVLREINPRLVYAQIKGFARNSPYERFPCWDPIAQAMSGASSVTGEPDGLPMKPGPDVGDTGTGMMAALGIIAALYQRVSTGEGQLVEVSMADNVAAALRIQYGYPVGQNIPTPRFGNGPPFTFPTSPSGLFECTPFETNDYVHIHCGNERQWQALLTAIGRTDLSDHEPYQGAEARGRCKEEVDEIVATWTRQRTKLEAMRELGAAGVPAGAVRTTLELLHDDDLYARGIFVRVPHPELGTVTIPGWPVQMSASPARVTAPPQPGQNGSEVISDWLGTSPEAAREQADAVAGGGVRRG
ncbi:MAG TPA: CoA transferase [Solirubrobacteraceae bacterium]|jgi:formyl-CoA transferase|nr:CoA transferase [Solirubrobacteraceae bacterium]